MTEKEHISATVDPEVAAYLSRSSVNASGLINRLVKDHIASDGKSKEYLEFRLDNLETQISTRKATLDSLENEAEIVREKLDEAKESEKNDLEEALEKCEDIEWVPENNGLQTQAENVGMTPEEFIEELEEYHD